MVCAFELDCYQRLARAFGDGGWLAMGVGSSKIQVDWKEKSEKGEPIWFDGKGLVGTSVSGTMGRLFCVLGWCGW